MQTEPKGFTIPTSLIPRCPICGSPMDMHLRKDACFAEDSNWQQAAERYGQFLDRYSGKNLLLLELGVGFNTPSIIRYPFERLTLHNPENFLIRFKNLCSQPFQ